MDDVQYNRNSQDNQVTELCATMTNNDSDGNPLDRLTKYIGNNKKDDCIDSDYQSELRILRRTFWSSEAIDSRLWLWQTCTEFGYFQGNRAAFKTFRIAAKSSCCYITVNLNNEF